MMQVLVVGPSCAVCDEAEQRVREAVDALGLDCRIERVRDFTAIIELQVYAIPGLVVDGVVKCVGRVPLPHELADWLDAAPPR